MTENTSNEGNLLLIAVRKSSNEDGSLSSIVYDPLQISLASDMIAGKRLEDFFKVDVDYAIRALRTQHNPGSLTSELMSRHGFNNGSFGIIGRYASFTSTPEQAVDMIEDLTVNPNSYSEF
jgi:hypothetical protein